MDRLIYTSLTAMRGSMSRQTAIANNLANAQTPGFRADMANAQSLWLDGSGLDARAMASEEVLGADMRAGTVTQTGRDLDIAMQGDALLVVQAKDGGILPDDPEARLLTRSIEGSNVTATSALVEMIEASRSWDTQLKMISDVRDMDSATANLMQLPR